MELADYYWAEKAVQNDLIREQRTKINRNLDERVRRLMDGVDDAKTKVPAAVIMRNRTPERNMRRIFGNAKGDEINAYLFRPVQDNEAERIRFVNRMHNEVRTFLDRDGKNRGLNQEERALVQLVIEGRAAEDAVNAMVAKITEEVGHINILVNNAGIIKRIPMTEMTAAQFRQVIDVDLNAPFIVAKAVIPDMIAQGGGKIINICSMMSELGRETVSAYAAAKGGLKMLTKNIASEYGEYNIQCNGMGPGYIATAQTAPLREIQPDGSRHPFDTFICAKTPAGRWGTPEDMVGPCVFLASHASDFVNGQILYADGGILAYIGKQPK